MSLLSSDNLWNGHILVGSQMKELGSRKMPREYSLIWREINHCTIEEIWISKSVNDGMCKMIGIVSLPIG